MNIKKILIITLLAIPVIALGQTNLNSGLDARVDSGTDSSVTNTRTTDSTPVKTVDSELAPVKTDNSEIAPSASVKTVSNTTTRTYSDSEKEQSIVNVAETVKEINEESKRVESDVRAEIKSGIDKSILNIRTQADIEAYELQAVIDETRNNIFEEVRQTIKTSSPIDSAVIDDLELKIENAATDIESKLQEKSGVEVDISENVRSIKNTLLRYREIVEDKKEIIENRDIDLIDKDTDGDGLSDYDEVYIYNTDPENKSTTGGKTDAEKVASGINPASQNEEAINYEDPRIDQDSVISELYTVNKVEIIDAANAKNVKIQGTGLPNSFITVYIYSTPIIVTVKTDARGEWEYTLDKELEDGEHNVYVATVNNTGKLIARSDAITFTKTAEAAALGTFGIGEVSANQSNFIQENFILIILAILLAAILVTLMLTGNKKKELESPLDETGTSGENPNNI